MHIKLYVALCVTVYLRKFISFNIMCGWKWIIYHITGIHLWIVIPFLCNFHVCKYNLCLRALLYTLGSRKDGTVYWIFIKHLEQLTNSYKKSLYASVPGLLFLFGEITLVWKISNQLKCVFALIVLIIWNVDISEFILTVSGFKHSRTDFR